MSRLSFYVLSVFIVIACCCLQHQQQCSAQQSSTVRPYKFGFTIDEQQHRREQRDERGIVMGEFGFITADGIYHVTVYATDEEGRFRILAMKNYPYQTPTKTVEIMLTPKAAPTTTTTTTTTTPKAELPRHNFYNEACSGCFLSNGKDKPKVAGETPKTEIRTLSKPLPSLPSTPSKANVPTVNVAKQQPNAVAGSSAKVGGSTTFTASPQTTHTNSASPTKNAVTNIQKPSNNIQVPKKDSTKTVSTSSANVAPKTTHSAASTAFTSKPQTVQQSAQHKPSTAAVTTSAKPQKSNSFATPAKPNTLTNSAPSGATNFSKKSPQTITSQTSTNLAASVAQGKTTTFSNTLKAATVANNKDSQHISTLTNSVTAANKQSSSPISNVASFGNPGTAAATSIHLVAAGTNTKSKNTQSTHTTLANTAINHTQTPQTSKDTTHTNNNQKGNPKLNVPAKPTAGQQDIMDVIIKKVLPPVLGSKGIVTKPNTVNAPSGKLPAKSNTPSTGNAGSNSVLGKGNSNFNPKTSAAGDDGDLYRFKYILDYHGHTETGKRNGNKEGTFYSIGDDDIERTIEYVANENGYQPRIHWRKVDKKDSLPKENTLKDYEFVWFNQK